MTALVALTILALLGVSGALVSQVDRPYPGFFFSVDARVVPVTAASRAAGLRFGDHIVAVDGGTRWTYTASGMTTNIAARLAAQAGAGEIVISESTLGHLGDGLLVEDLGVRELKNVEPPMRLFRLS